MFSKLKKLVTDGDNVLLKLYDKNSFDESLQKIEEQTQTDGFKFDEEICLLEHDVIEKTKKLDIYKFIGVLAIVVITTNLDIPNDKSPFRLLSVALLTILSTVYFTHRYIQLTDAITKSKKAILILKLLKDRLN